MGNAFINKTYNNIFQKKNGCNPCQSCTFDVLYLLQITPIGKKWLTVLSTQHLCNSKNSNVNVCFKRMATYTKMSFKPRTRQRTNWLNENKEKKTYSINSTTHKSKDWATRTEPKTMGNLSCFERSSGSNSRCWIIFNLRAEEFIFFNFGIRYFHLIVRIRF